MYRIIWNMCFKNYTTTHLLSAPMGTLKQTHGKKTSSFTLENPQSRSQQKQAPKFSRAGIMLPLLAVSSSGLEQCLTHSRCTVNILGSITESPSCSLCLYLLLLVWFEFLTLYLNSPPCLHGVCLSPWFLSSHFIPWCCHVLFTPSVCRVLASSVILVGNFLPQLPDFLELVSAPNLPACHLFVSGGERAGKHSG